MTEGIRAFLQKRHFYLGAQEFCVLGKARVLDRDAAGTGSQILDIEAVTGRPSHLSTCSQPSAGITKLLTYVTHRLQLGPGVKSVSNNSQYLRNTLIRAVEAFSCERCWKKPLICLMMDGR